MGRIFAIGDIHGMYYKLVFLLDRIDKYGITDQDTLVFLGDYIDRGKKSYDVVERLRFLEYEYNDVVFLKGNHEEMFLNYVRYGDSEPINAVVFLQNGGIATMDSYLEHGYDFRKKFPREHLDFLDNLQLTYETDDYFFCHAGVHPMNPLHEQDEDDLLWIRKDFIHSNKDFGKIIVFGHCVFKEPLIQDNKIGIDTGAFKEGCDLTCVVLPDMEFITA